MNEPQTHRDAAIEALTSLTARIIGAAIEVHRVLGPGLLESIYETAMSIELDNRGLNHERQTTVPARDKGRPLGEYRIDLIVENAVVVEIKCVTHLLPVFDAQLLTYLRLGTKRLGLLIDFHSRLVKDGIRRIVL